jgi:uroporphyrinogen-III decarboxylase
MNAQQWETLVAVVRGETPATLPVGFIIDSPWLPGWAGHTLLDYYTDDRTFLDDNLRAIAQFPDAIMLPGFWSEFGMCTEPSAFGAVSVFEENAFPFAKPMLRSPDDVARLEKPDPRAYGLLPIVIKRLQHLQPAIKAAGHEIRFAISRGPLNIASFLMGATEFLTAVRTHPADMHQLLTIITDFLVEWVAWQRECFPTIDGLLVLDDVVGFVGPRDFGTFVQPYLSRVFDTDVTVKCFHNDAPCKTCAPHLAGMGINLLNFGVQHTLSEMRAWTGGAVTLLGNLPPRDVLAAGTPDDVARETAAMLDAFPERSRLIVSCGGGMPPDVPTANIAAMIDAVKSRA